MRCMCRRRVTSSYFVTRVVNATPSGVSPVMICPTCLRAFTSMMATRPVLAERHDCVLAVWCEDDALRARILVGHAVQFLARTALDETQFLVAEIRHQHRCVVR
jgi:hypothetical protein